MATRRVATRIATPEPPYPAFPLLLIATDGGGVRRSADVPAAVHVRCEKDGTSPAAKKDGRNYRLLISFGDYFRPNFSRCQLVAIL
jgi:hypothetical protein